MSIRRRFFFLVLLIVLATTMTAAQHRQGDCDRDTDTGTLFCGMGCKTFSTGSSCWPIEGISAPAYCWQASFVEPPGAAPACHAGNYDQCCDTSGGF